MFCVSCLGIWWLHDIWIPEKLKFEKSQDWKVWLKWNEKYVSLLYKCSFTEFKIRLAEMYRTQPFKLVLIGIWKTFGTANLWTHVTNFLHFLYYDCWKVLSGYLVIHIFYAKNYIYIYIYIYIMSIMQTQPHLVCVTNICLPETLKYWVGVQQDQSYLMERRCLISLGWPPF